MIGIPEDRDPLTLVVEVGIDQGIDNLPAFEREGCGNLDTEPVFYRHDEIIGSFDADGQF